MHTLLHSLNFWMLVVLTFGPALCVCAVTSILERDR